MNNKINIKRQRIKINNHEDFILALKRENLCVDDLDLSEEVNDYINKSFNESKITYKVNDVQDFIDYVKAIIIFNKLHIKLCKIISKIKILEIERLEYERNIGICDDVDDITPKVIKVKNNMTGIMSEEEKNNILIIEKEISDNHIYSKDIELLKRMIIQKDNSSEAYNIETKIKTILVKVQSKLKADYIKGEKGSVEYHNNLIGAISRMKRLIKNLDKYIVLDKDIHKINQSETLQDSINIAKAFYDGKSFQAVSGSNEIKDDSYIKTPGKPFFRSIKVNKLGKLGTGYNRAYDSEKKILEEIHKNIKNKNLNDRGTLYLFTKWEPCSSCCYVISQFLDVHPFVEIKVKYIKKYGEENKLIY